MANFVKNGPCHKCGSRDNLAHYDDGSKWCWGCHYYEPRTHLPSTERLDREEDRQHKRLPDDTGTWFGPDSISWFSSYGFSVEQLIPRGVRFSPSKNQTIFTFEPTGLWQARNHWPQSKVKYFTSGNHDSVLPVYFSTPSHADGHSTCVLVEDCLSAIKIASTVGPDGPLGDAMPLLGSHLPTEKLLRLRGLYKTLLVWLDHDKGKEAQNICTRAKLVGMEAHLISTELDPKEYDAEFLIQELSK